MLVKMENPNGGGSEYKVAYGAAGEITLSRSQTTKITCGFKPKAIICGTANLLSSGGYGSLSVYFENMTTSKCLTADFYNGSLNQAYLRNLPYTGQIPELQSVDDDGFTVAAVSVGAYSISDFTYVAIG